LHTILDELEDEAKSPTSLLNRRGTARKPELDILVNNLLGVLWQIEDIVKRYHSLGNHQKRTWDRVKFATEDLAALRGKLSVYVNSIELFIASLSAGSLARIEGILDELVQEIKAGRKEPTVISTCEDDDDVAWSELERENVGDGITRQDVEKYKDDIKEYLKKLIQGNLMGFGSGSSDSLSAGFDDLEIEDRSPERYSFDSRQSKQLRSIRGSSTPGFPSQQDHILAIPERQRDHVSRKYGRSSDRQEEKLRGITRNPNVDGADQQLWKQAGGLPMQLKNAISAFNVKPVFLKGISSGSSTSIKQAFIRSSIITVLRRLGVEYVEFRGGFGCRHHGPTRREISFSGFNGSNGRDPEKSPQTSSDTKVLRRARDSLGISSSKGFANAEESFSGVDGDAMSTIRPHIGSELGGSSILAFEIFIVKTHLPPLYRIQFKRLAGGTLQFRNMAGLILHELRLLDSS
jgi:hypothetical protein